MRLRTCIIYLEFSVFCVNRYAKALIVITKYKKNIIVEFWTPSWDFIAPTTQTNFYIRICLRPLFWVCSSLESFDKCHYQQRLSYCFCFTIWWRSFLLCPTQRNLFSRFMGNSLKSTNMYLPINYMWLIKLVFNSEVVKEILRAMACR